MNSIIRAASRFGARPIMDRILPRKSIMISGHGSSIAKRWAHNQPLTYDFVRERILLVIKLFDKVDPNKVTLDSHFINDLGLDSLDQVEIIMQLEDEFLFEIPDKDAEFLSTPGHILKYITDKEEAYKELQDMHAHHHHDDHHGAKHEDHGHHHGNHNELNSNHTQTRGFSSLAYMSKRYMSITTKNPDGSDVIYPTSFRAKPPEKVSFDDVQARVMKVLSKYDKIDSSKLELASHFVQDLGLDSLDHVEIMMELEDEFGVEIPDQEAEKLMRPAEVARFVFQQEEKRALQVEDRPL